MSKASDQEKSTYRATMESQLNGAEAKLPSYRAASGVDDMVCVYVLLDADNSVIYQKVMRQFYNSRAQIICALYAFSKRRATYELS